MPPLPVVMVIRVKATGDDPGVNTTDLAASQLAPQRAERLAQTLRALGIDPDTTR